MENEKLKPDARVRVAFIVVMRNGDWQEVESFLRSKTERIQYVKRVPTSVRLNVNEIVMPRNEKDLKEESKNDKWSFTNSDLEN